MINHCHICYSTNVDEDFICDTCDEYYCEDCSYSFTLHYQFQGSRCYLCSNQNRRDKLDKDVKRDNKLELILQLIKNY